MNWGVRRMLPIGMSPDPWRIPPELFKKYEDQFLKLTPLGSLLTGDQAKTLFLQSGLPPPMLAHIWNIADINADGKMDRNEFAIAMHLIQHKLKGGELPQVLPLSLRNLAQPPSLGGPSIQGAQSIISSAAPILPSTGAIPSASAPILPYNLPGIPGGYIRPASPIDTRQKRSASVSSSQEPQSIPPSILTEWAIPQASKLKYTQIFNTHDRTRTGYLSGAQARSILMQCSLPQPVLAQIWNLSDIDCDGRLTSEEFVVCMYLIDTVRAGDPLPSTLPFELIPPTMRRKRSASIQSGGPTSHPTNLLGDLMSADLKEEEKLKNQTTFEDKRKENFEKGQAELERRRLALLESQRKEQEERERKEREEQEKREKIRLEQEKRRQMELEKQLAKQREIEQEKEEQRRKALEQREAARKEMERQRQLEWEKQRNLELTSQRQKEQESVCHLKNKSKNLTFKITQLNTQVVEMTQKVTETRKSVNDIKSSIDNMRIERDVKMKELNFLKQSIKDLNNKLLIITQEKANMGTNVKSQASNPSINLVINDFNNKQISMHQLNNSLSNIEKDSIQKKQDIENNNLQLNKLKDELRQLMESQDELYHTYEEKRKLVLNLKNKNNTSAWQEPAWEPSTAWPKEAEETKAEWVDDSAIAIKQIKYKVLYPFESRNEDELSIMPGDIVLISEGESPEPGWLKGELQGKRGWFPETYVELANSPTDKVVVVGTEVKHALEEIAEAPEIVSETFQFSEDSSFTQIMPKEEIAITPPEEVVPAFVAAAQEILAKAIFPWSAKKDNHISFAKGDIIKVIEQQDTWWSGKINGQIGWFPHSYVKLIDNESQQIDEPSEGEYHVAAFAYQSDEPGDLNFQQGELILVVNKEGDWWTGILDSKTGIFPSNYVLISEAIPTFTTQESVPVEEVEEEPIPVEKVEVVPESTFQMEQISQGIKKPEIVHVIADYQASGPEQLTLQKGQLIQVKKKNQSGWWEGEMQAKGKKRQLGWFPASYVKSLSSSAANSNRSTPDPMKHVESPETDKVIAIYPFIGQQEDELVFEKGQVITIVTKEDGSWWKGEIDGRVGFFPKSYVKSHHSN